MEDKLDNLIKEARGIALTADEKAAGRDMLEQYMLLTPVRVQAAPAKRRSAFFAPALIGKTASVFSLVLGLMLSSAGISYAAEGALPGDALYPVKVSVNEELRAALAPTPEAKASWEAERAERRLAEAETLAKKGELRAETRASLQADFKRHAEKAKSDIAEFSVSADANAAANVAAHLEGSLRAHKKIIAALAADAGTGSAEVDELEASVDAEADATEQERGKAEAKVSEGHAADAEAAAKGRRGAAENKIAEVRTYLAAKRDALGAEATADAEARLSDAQAVVADGNAKFDAGDFSGAFVAYGKAQRMAQEAKLLIRAGHDLRIRVKLDGREDGGNDVPPSGGERPKDDGRSVRQEDPKDRTLDARTRTESSVRTGGSSDREDVRVDARLKLKLDL
ncbi:MAG TPA: DUF5667 domain-containing protein [Patescibacteria group bacterium]|nr:DUF5667 domain-containing protein [Patescibacteria group bacterium]